MRTRILPLLALTLSVAPLTTRANDIEPGKENYSAPKKSIVVDGNLSDWGGVPVFKDTKFTVPKPNSTDPNAPGVVIFEQCAICVSPNPTDWTGPDDQSSAFAIAWDEGNLYVGVVVVDDYHFNPTSGWNGDSLQIAFTDAARTTISNLYNVALPGTNDVFGLVTDVPNGDVNEKVLGGGLVVSNDVAIVRDPTNNLTFYEVKFAARTLGYTKFEAGMQIGVGLCMNDGDADSMGQAGWSGWGAHSIVFGKTASEAGLVTLQAGLSDLEYHAEPAHLTTIDGIFSDWAGLEFQGPNGFSVPKGDPNGSNVVFETANGGTWTGPSDQTSTFSISWQSNNLYLGVLVVDDWHNNSFASGPQDGDSLQVLFANEARTTITQLYNYFLAGDDDLGLRDVMIENEQGPGGTVAAIVRDKDNHKTYYEIQFPASSLGVASFHEGMKFGFALAVNDADQDETGQTGGWSGWAPHAILPGHTVQQAGLVTLVGAKAQPTIEFSAPKAGYKFVDGDLSDWETHPFIGPVPFRVPKGDPNGQLVYFEVCTLCVPTASWTGPDDQTSVLSFDST